MDTEEIGRSCLAGCFISKINKKDLLAQIQTWIKTKDKGLYITAINVSKLVMIKKDIKLAAYVANSTVNIADGFPIYWAPKLLGDPVPERITGVELMEDLFIQAHKHHYRIYFLGAKPETLKLVVEQCKAEYPGMVVVGSQDGYFDDESVVVTKIAEVEPDILFVALGVPQKEYFVYDHVDRLNTTVCIPVGGAFDVYAGNKVRVPKYVQKVGMEWLWRSFYDRSRALMIYQSIGLFLLMFLSEFWLRKVLRKKDNLC